MAVYRDIKVEIPKEHVTIERQKGGKPALIKYVLSAKFNREKGHAKYGQNVNIVSFSYAVTPEGKPVTYETYRGGLIDAKIIKTEAKE